MNRKICLTASGVLTVSVTIFFICQGIAVFLDNPLTAWISFGTCIFLSWGYLITSIGHSCLCSADKKIAAESAKIMGVIYSVFICIVYFSQLTVVRQAVLGPDILNAFSFDYPGSWLFSMDIIGYGIMALSTIFLGLSIEPETKSDNILRWTSLIHGIFVVCIFIPMTSLFLGNSGNSGLNKGAIALMTWCVIFFPIAFCSFLRFKNAKKYNCLTIIALRI